MDTYITQLEHISSSIRNYCNTNYTRPYSKLPIDLADERSKYLVVVSHINSSVNTLKKISQLKLEPEDALL